MPTLIDFVVEHDFVDVLNKVDPLPTNPAYMLVDRHCAMLDGHCNCLREEGKSFPNCEKYHEHP